MVSSKNQLPRPAFKFGRKWRNPNRNKDDDFAKNNTLLNLIWNSLKEKIEIGDFTEYTFKAKFIARKIDTGYELKNLKMVTVKNGAVKKTDSGIV